MLNSFYKLPILTPFMVTWLTLYTSFILLNISILITTTLLQEASDPAMAGAIVQYTPQCIGRRLAIQVTSEIASWALQLNREQTSKETKCWTLFSYWDLLFYIKPSFLRFPGIS